MALFVEYYAMLPIGTQKVLRVTKVVVVVVVVVVVDVL